MSNEQPKRPDPRIITKDDGTQRVQVFGPWLKRWEAAKLLEENGGPVPNMAFVRTGWKLRVGDLSRVDVRNGHPTPFFLSDYGDRSHCCQVVEHNPFDPKFTNDVILNCGQAMYPERAREEEETHYAVWEHNKRMWEAGQAKAKEPVAEAELSDEDISKAFDGIYSKVIETPEEKEAIRTYSRCWFDYGVKFAMRQQNGGAQ